MYVATRDVMLPTTIIGSLPRPLWYTARLDDRRLSGTDGRTWDRGDRAPAPVGTIMHEIGEASSQPVVVGPVGRGTLQYTQLWQTAQQLTPTPVKFGTPVAEVIEGRLANRHYADRRALVLDIADALNAELTALARAGCPAVQLEAPWITRSANRQRPDMWEVDFYVQVLERTTRGLQALTEV